MQKPGWKTTEFWAVVVLAVLSVAVAAGVITPEQSEQISNAVVQTIDAVANLVSVLAPLAGVIMYIWSRTMVKTNGK